MSVFKFISGIFKPAADLIDELHTSEEEKLNIKAALFAAQTQATIKTLEYEKDILEQRTRIITAETQADSWLTRSWRPMVMLFFTFIVGCVFFGFTPPGVPEAFVVEIMSLIKLGLGGYVIGRSAEKVLPQVADVIRQGTTKEDVTDGSR